MTRREQLAMLKNIADNLTQQKNIMSRLRDIERELLISRKDNEAFLYGEPVEDNDDVDLTDVSPKEGE